MSTITHKSIGTTGRDYSTVAAWEAAAPANLTTSIAGGEIWQGETYNDSEFLITSAITVSGSTTDTTGYKVLTTGTGQSFADHANKLTNALTYNQSNGVGIRTTTGYVSPIVAAEAEFHASKLQLWKNNGSGSSAFDASAGNKTYLDQSIVIDDSSGNNSVLVVDGIVSNCLIVRTVAGRAVRTTYPTDSASGVFNCTVVVPSDVGGSDFGIVDAGGTTSNFSVKNNAVFGFTAAGNSVSYGASSDYNATDAASVPFGGSHNQVGKTYTSQFQNTLLATRDFRTKSSGTDLAANGTRDAAHTNDLDIVGQSRSLTTPTIGCWEVVSGGGGAVSGAVSITGSSTDTAVGASLASDPVSISGTSTLSAQGASLASGAVSVTGASGVSWVSPSGGFTAKFRKTLSGIGSRVGSRQTHN